MPIVIGCACGKRFAARDDLAGQTLTCPACGQSLIVPGGNPPPAKEAAPAAGSPIVVTCRCGARFGARPDLAGKTLGCPKCGASLTVPGGEPSAGKGAVSANATAAAAPIVVTCQCGARFGARPDLAGKTLGCPKCGASLTVPGSLAASPPASSSKPAPPQQPAAPPPPIAGGLDDLLDEAGLKPTKTGVRCAKCRADMKPGSLLCVQCGYNHETDSYQQTKRWT